MTYRSFTLAEARRLAKIAERANLRIDRTDYGWTIGAYNERLKKGVIVSEVYRQERDGYIGGRIIAEDVLRDWIKDNPA